MTLRQSRLLKYLLFELREAAGMPMDEAVLHFLVLPYLGERDGLPGAQDLLGHPVGRGTPGARVAAQGAGMVGGFQREPLVVAGITLHPLTLSGYLRLSEIRSPLLSGRWPEDGGEHVKAIAEALEVFSGEAFETASFHTLFSAQEAFDLRLEMEAMMARAFSTLLKMEFPCPDGSALRARHGGFGKWLLIYTSLRLMRIPREEALNMPLEEAFALRAAAQFLEGANVAGQTYLQRETPATIAH